MFDATSKFTALSLALVLAGCPSAPVVPEHPADDAAPRAALEEFLRDQQAGNFAGAYALLAAPLRARYTPERLASDYARDRSLADDKLARIRAALSAGTPMQLSNDRAALPLAQDRAVQLVSEQGAWHIASLE